MSKKIKIIIFSLLLVLFLVFTALVDTVGTETDQGAGYLTPAATTGKLLFQKYNCTACHQIYGLGGYMGPDLTNVMSAPGKGYVYAKAILAYGSNRMPNFHLSETETDCLIAYLNYVDKTGLSPVRNFDIHADGTVTYKP
ncbi:MAG TPA: cytochrome c [Bacteroidia bacterium]|jgi:nitric oxide reductase subunit C|nr:cytochrome c [Bacteroidia bacterium]